MSSTHFVEPTRLAQIDSAKVITLLVLGTPQPLLEVVAQRSGFNWELRLQPGALDQPQGSVDYYPYLVLETQIGPSWPPHEGPGPVVTPTTLHTYVTHVGKKGIEVFGHDFHKRFDIP